MKRVPTGPIMASLSKRECSNLRQAPGSYTSSNKCHATRNKCIATSNKCLTSSNKKLLAHSLDKPSGARHGSWMILVCFYMAHPPVFLRQFSEMLQGRSSDGHLTDLGDGKQTEASTNGPSQVMRRISPQNGRFHDLIVSFDAFLGRTSEQVKTIPGTLKGSDSVEHFLQAWKTNFSSQPFWAERRFGPEWQGMLVACASRFSFYGVVKQERRRSEPELPFCVWWHRCLW